MIRLPLPRAERAHGWQFMDAIAAAYARLNARRAAEYETELVPLSNAPGAPKVLQYLLPLDKPKSVRFTGSYTDGPYKEATLHPDQPQGLDKPRDEVIR